MAELYIWLTNKIKVCYQNTFCKNFFTLLLLAISKVHLNLQFLFTTWKPERDGISFLKREDLKVLSENVNGIRSYAGTFYRKIYCIERALWNKRKSENANKVNVNAKVTK